MMQLNTFTACLSCFTAAVFIACNYAGESTAEKAEKIRRGETEKYFNKFKKPDWIRDPDEHIPQYTIKQDKQFKYINVTVSLKGTLDPLHYIELIILADHNHRELQKVTFPLGNPAAAAVFKLPADYQSFVYIIAKCNLHDMWETKVCWE